MPTVVCRRCGKSVHRYPSQIKRGGTYCSRECQNLRTGKQCECEICGKPFYQPASRIKRGDGRFCSVPCKAEWQASGECSGANNPAWKGGRFLDKVSGYIYIRKGGKYIGEHRLVMERHIGRSLESCEQVHHINGDKTDNRVENLEILSASEHHKRHWKFCP